MQVAKKSQLMFWLKCSGFLKLLSYYCIGKLKLLCIGGSAFNLINLSQSIAADSDYLYIVFGLKKRICRDLGNIDRYLIFNRNAPNPFSSFTGFTCMLSER